MVLFLDFLTKYSNLVLAIITSVYVFLTWKMVSEMRVARESQDDARLIASPVALGPVCAQVRLQNAGPGPALDVEISISFDPPLDIPTRTWRHPALLVGQIEHFFLPGAKIDALRELAEKHKSLVIDLKWTNIFGRQKSKFTTFNLHDLAEGWYNAHHLSPPDDIPTQLNNVTRILENIHRDLENIGRELKK